jgi:septal ring factor EnvC (AmiA/AmiB activator)
MRPKKPRRKPQPVAAIPDAEAGLAAFEPEKLAPTALGKEQSSTVQALEQRVEQRQKELDKLNERLKSLQQESQALQDSIKANNQPIEEAKGRQLKRVE